MLEVRVELKQIAEIPQGERSSYHFQTPTRKIVSESRIATSRSYGISGQTFDFFDFANTSMQRQAV
jgi:hypothetical protein